MKLGNDVLLEIVDIVRQGLSEGTDISQKLRELELEPSDYDLTLCEFVQLKKKE